MSRPSAWGMRAWVALLVLAVTLPLGALVYWNARREAQDEEVHARRHVAEVARQMAAETGMFLGDTRALLERVARHPGVAVVDATHCPPLLAGGAELFPKYGDVLLVDRAGRLLCATPPALADVDGLAQMTWWRRAADGQAFVVDAPRITGARKRWAAVAAVPVREPGGAVASVLAVTIDLADFPVPLLPAEVAADGATVGIVDRAGTIVVHSRGAEHIGKPAPPHVRASQRAGGSTSAAMAPESEPDYVTAVAPVAQSEWDAVAIYPREAVVGHGERHLRRTLLLGALVLLAVWVAAALLLRSLLHPVRAVADAAMAVGIGEQRVRVRPGGPREIARIGENFNRMLDARERDEAALRGSEARYRALFETSGDAVVGLDGASRIVFANPAIERLSGWRPDELVGRELAILQPEALRQSHRQALARLTAKPAAPVRGTNETTLLHRDGREIPIEVRFARVELGEEWLFVGLMRDISERQATLASLRESEARFRATADSAPVLIWTADANGRVTYFNATWLAFRGLSHDEATTHGWLDGIHPDDRTSARAGWQETLARRIGATVEYRRLRHDGEYRWLLDVRAPRFADDGRFLGFAGSAVDIHDRKLGEQRIRRLTALYGALSRSNEAIARSRDLDSLLQQVCDVVVRETGIATAVVAFARDNDTRLAAVAASGLFADRYCRHDVPIVQRPLGEETPGSLAFRSNAAVVSNDRESDPNLAPIAFDEVRPRLRSTAVFPLRRGERPVGIFVVYAAQPGFFDDELVRLLGLLAADLAFALESHEDRQQREGAEDALRRLNVTLEERVAERTRSLEVANHELEAFSYSVSHDLRAPLRSINGFSELLQEGYGHLLDSTGQGYLDRVKVAATRMGRLIDDLLNLSRIARQSLSRAQVDVSRLAGEIVEELRGAQPEREVEVVIEPGLAANADPGLARIVLDNLIGNAWKFTSRTQRARIAIGAATLDGHPAFAVRDNGAGFDPAYADRLFAPFQRLHSERDYPGSGIGLAIVQRILRRHGGEVTAEGAPGSGATFTFRFGPAAPA